MRTVSTASTVSSKQIALIHVAKRDLGLDDDNLLVMLFERDALSSEHLQGYINETFETMTGLAVAEEKIIAGLSPIATPN